MSAHELYFDVLLAPSVWNRTAVSMQGLVPQTREVPHMDACPTLESQRKAIFSSLCFYIQRRSMFCTVGTAAVF